MSKRLRTESGKTAARGEHQPVAMEDELPHKGRQAMGSLDAELTHFRSACESLREIALKVSSGASDLPVLRSQSLLLFLELRHLNRLITSRIEQHKAAVQSVGRSSRVARP